MHMRTYTINKPATIEDLLFHQVVKVEQGYGGTLHLTTSTGKHFVFTKPHDVVGPSFDQWTYKQVKNVLTGRLITEVERISRVQGDALLTGWNLVVRGYGMPAKLLRCESVNQNSRMHMPLIIEQIFPPTQTK